MNWAERLWWWVQEQAERPAPWTSRTEISMATAAKVAEAALLEATTALRVATPSSAATKARVRCDHQSLALSLLSEMMAQAEDALETAPWQDSAVLPLKHPASPQRPPLQRLACPQRPPRQYKGRRPSQNHPTFYDDTWQCRTCFFAWISARLSREPCVFGCNPSPGPSGRVIRQMRRAPRARVDRH